MPILMPQPLTDFAKAILVALGAPDDIARCVADSLVSSNLVGHDSHGVLQLPRYAGKIENGQINPGAYPRLLEINGATARIDGRWGFGQVTARFATDHVIELARRHGIGCVALSRTTHGGRLGEYVEEVARENLVGLMIVSGAPIGGAVAPYGGTERIFGTNPLAVAIPSPGDQGALVLDFATSVVAAGKLHLAADKGEPIPRGWVVSKDGRNSTDPSSFEAGGALLPFGGHKGYGLCLMIEIVANLLAGSVPASSPDYRHLASPAVMIACSVERFRPLEEFRHYVRELSGRVRNCRPAIGFDEVLLPGELEARCKASRTVEGIVLPDVTWELLLELAARLGVTSPETRR